MGKIIKADFGVTGMAVMGQNLALNIESRGFAVAVHNRTVKTMREFVRAKGALRSIVPAPSLRDLVRSLKRPRRIMLMVKAGAAVDDTIAKLLPLMDKGDVLIDGGNSFFRDTDRRFAFVESKGIGYIGCGVSGGEYGALHGPSIMPGGRREVYAKVKDVLLKAAARTVDGSCCTYLGKTSAGHFVKMVHNGIEYAIMQQIAEVYDVMRVGLGMSAGEAQETFERWNSGKLNSYLIEITARVLKKKDDITGRPLVEMIVDRAGQKGTGKWTSQAALDLGVPVPTITASVDARIVSGHKQEREKAAPLLRSDPLPLGSGGRKETLDGLENACFAAGLISYAQGLHLLKRASDEYGYGVNMAEVARIWKGGCIVRARALDVLRSAFLRTPDLPHLFLDRLFVGIIRAHVGDLRRTIMATAGARIAVPCLSSALSYHDGFARGAGPANLIQAQRDFFGAHTFERTDRPGSFHADWSDV